MQTHQHLADLLELFDGTEIPIDGTETAPRLIQLARQDHLVPFTLDPKLLQSRDDAVIRIEDPFHFEEISAGTDEIRLRPPSGENRKSIDQDRLPRSCLTRKNRDPFREIDHRILDDGKIHDM